MAGLDGILISVNPSVVEQVPFNRIQKAVTVGHEVFGFNTIIYQEFFYNLFQAQGIKGTLPFPDFLEQASHSLPYLELLPMGRTVYKLEFLFTKTPAGPILWLPAEGRLCLKMPSLS